MLCRGATEPLTHQSLQHQLQPGHEAPAFLAWRLFLTRLMPKKLRWKPSELRSSKLPRMPPRVTTRRTQRGKMGSPGDAQWDLGPETNGSVGVYAERSGEGISIWRRFGKIDWSRTRLEVEAWGTLAWDRRGISHMDGGTEASKEGRDRRCFTVQDRTRTLADTIASRTADWLFDGCLFLFFSASAYGFSFFYSYKGHDGDCVTLLIPIPAHLHYPSRQEDHLSHSHRSGQLTWLSCANLYSRANYTHSHSHSHCPYHILIVICARWAG